jgi:hypothetical protein
MSEKRGLEDLVHKLELLQQYEQLSLQMKNEPVDLWEAIVDKKNDLIAKINQVNVHIAHSPQLSDDAVSVKKDIQVILIQIQQLDAELIQMASQARQDLVASMKKNNQNPKIQKYIANTKDI